MDTLGRAHERRRAYPEALAAYQDALELADAEADPRTYGVILHDIADVHRAQGDLEEAARLFRTGRRPQARREMPPPATRSSRSGPWPGFTRGSRRPGEALRAGTEAVQVLKCLTGDQPHTLAETLVFAARTQIQSDPGQAVPLLEEARQLLAPEGVAEPAERVTVLDLLAAGLPGPGPGGSRPGKPRPRPTPSSPPAPTSWPARTPPLCWPWARSWSTGRTWSRPGSPWDGQKRSCRRGRQRRQPRKSGPSAASWTPWAGPTSAAGPTPKRWPPTRMPWSSPTPQPIPDAYGVILHDLADVHRAQGDLEEAARLFREAADHKRQGDASARDQVVTLRALAGAQRDLGRAGEALRAGTEAVQVLKASPETSPHTLAEMLVFAARTQIQSDPGQAVPLLEEASQLLAPEGAAERVTVLDLLAAAYRALGREDLAREATAAADGLLTTFPASFNISWPWNDDENSIASTSNEIRYGRLYIVLEPGAEGLRFNRRLVRFTQGPRRNDLDIGQRQQPRGRRRDSRPLVISLPYLEGSIEKITYVVDNNMLTLMVIPNSPAVKFRPGDVEFSRELPPDSAAVADGIVAASTDILAGEDIAALLALGQVLIDREDLEQAGIALGQAKAVLQARPPAEAAPEKRALSGLMDTLGRAHERRRAYPEALAAYHDALEFADADDDPETYAVILHDLADVHRAQGDLEEAARLFREAADRKRQGDASARDQVVTLRALAGAQRDLGRAGEALRAGTEAVQVLKASPETSPHTLAETLVFAARTQIQSDPGQAVPLLEEASQLLAPEGAAERVTVLDLLAAAYRALGREDLAREATAAADGIVAASTDILAGEDTAALLALGQVLIDREDLEQAGIALGQAKAVLQARPPAEAAPEKRALSGLMDTLGRAHERRRAYPEALAAYHDALEFADAAADPRWYGVILHDLADVHRAQGDLEEAARLFREAADRKRQGDASARDQVVTLRALAGAQRDLGRAGEALRAGTEAVQVLKASPETSPHTLAEMLVFAARTQIQSDPGQAVPLLEEASQLLAPEGAAERVTVLDLLAAAYRALGREDLAREATAAADGLLTTFPASFNIIVAVERRREQYRQHL